MLDEFINSFPSLVVFPKKKEDYPSILYEKEDLCIVIIHFGEHLLKEFLTTISFTSVMGMDAQFVNNKLRRPLYIVCAQDPLTFRTIPGFLALLGRNDQTHVTKALQLISEFIDQRDIFFPSFVMIDKCETQRLAIQAVGAKPILCQFHLTQLLMKRYKAIPSEFRTDVCTQVLKIQRSANAEELAKNIGDMAIFCKANKLNEFLGWFENSLLDEDWRDSWVDLTRISRSGIYNTNNASESFFKNLLRGFLKGVGNFSPAQMLRIISERMIPCLTFRSVAGGNRKNPSFKKMEKYTETIATLKAANAITKINENLFNIIHQSELHIVILDNESCHYTCSCGNFQWAGNCLHTYAVHHIYGGTQVRKATVLISSTSASLEKSNSPHRQLEAPATSTTAAPKNIVRKEIRGEQTVENDGLRSQNKIAKRKVIPSQRQRKDLPCRKKIKKKGNYVSYELKKSTKSKMHTSTTVHDKENVSQPSQTLGRQFVEIANGGELPRRRRVPPKVINL